MSHITLILLTASAVWPGGKYVDPNRLFELKVPADYRVRTGPDKGSDSYILVCHPDSTVCFEYPANRFPETNFNSASLEVTILKAATENACMDLAMREETTGADRSQPTRVIDGMKFLHTSGGEGAMSHDIDFHRYWGFDRGTCFELATAIAYTNFAVYEPGAIKEFTAKDKAAVTDELNRIIDSFHALK